MGDKNEITDLTVVGQPDSLQSWNGAANRGQTARQERVKIVKEVLRSKLDYGLIPGCGAKPVLFKAGAEKIADTFNLRAVYECLDTIQDFDKPLFFYRYRCVLEERTSGIVVTTGIGSCNNQEKKFKRDKDAFSMVNTIDKMAQKRAFVQAILLMGFSQYFTQDLDTIVKSQAMSATKLLSWIDYKCETVENLDAVIEYYSKTYANDYTPEEKQEFSQRIDGQREIIERESLESQIEQLEEE